MGHVKNCYVSFPAGSVTFWGIPFDDKIRSKASLRTRGYFPAMFEKDIGGDPQKNHSSPKSDILVVRNNNWLVVWNINFIFPYIGNLIIPIDFHIFQRGGPTTNQIKSPLLVALLKGVFRIERDVSTVIICPGAARSELRNPTQSWLTLPSTSQHVAKMVYALTFQIFVKSMPHITDGPHYLFQVYNQMGC